MKKRRIKSISVGCLLGITIGIMFSHIAYSLKIQDVIMLVTLLLTCMIIVALIAIDDLEVKLMKAYRRGRQDRIFTLYQPITDECRDQEHKED